MKLKESIGRSDIPKSVYQTFAGFGEQEEFYSHVHISEFSVLELGFVSQLNGMPPSTTLLMPSEILTSVLSETVVGKLLCPRISKVYTVENFAP